MSLRQLSFEGAMRSLHHEKYKQKKRKERQAKRLKNSKRKEKVK